MFGGILNATLPEVSITAVAQENVELSLLTNSLDSHQTQNKTKNVWLLVGQLTIKAGC